MKNVFVVSFNENGVGYRYKYDAERTLDESY